MIRPILDRVGPRGRSVLLALPVCLLAGCIDRVAQGETTVYTFATWILGLVVLGGLFLMFLGGLVVWKRPGWRGLAIIGLGVLVIAFFLPMMGLDRTEVAPDHFVSTHGMPWHRVRQEVRYDDLREIRVKVTEPPTGGNKSYALVCSDKFGSEQVVPLGALMKAALGQLVETARKRGIPVNDLDRLPANVQPR